MIILEDGIVFGRGEEIVIEESGALNGSLTIGRLCKAS